MIFQDTPQPPVEALAIEVHQFPFLVEKGVYHDLDSFAFQAILSREYLHIIDVAEIIRVAKIAPAAKPPFVEQQLIYTLHQSRGLPDVAGKPDTPYAVFTAQPAGQWCDGPFGMHMMM